MNKEPTKPKHIMLWKLVYFAAWFGFYWLAFLKTQFVKENWEAALLVFVGVCLFLYFWGKPFRKYQQELLEYNHEIERAKRIDMRGGDGILTDEQVAKNIAKYREEQRVKRENKLWWQFWI